MPTMATGVTAAFVLLLALVAHTEAPTSPTATGGCTDELLSFSACLSYVSSPPNDLNERPSANCCAAFNSAAESGGAICLCYFVRYPNILGFPINSTRLISLSSICNPTPPLSLNFLCSGSSSFFLFFNLSHVLGFSIITIRITMFSFIHSCSFHVQHHRLCHLSTAQRHWDSPYLGSRVAVEEVQQHLRLVVGHQKAGEEEGHFSFHCHQMETAQLQHTCAAATLCYYSQ
nr:uncharacterized protein LOC112801302 isoform X1 [Arachis hypogaea]